MDYSSYFNDEKFADAYLQAFDSEGQLENPIPIHRIFLSNQNKTFNILFSVSSEEIPFNGKPLYRLNLSKIPGKNILSKFYVILEKLYKDPGKNFIENEDFFSIYDYFRIKDSPYVENKKIEIDCDYLIFVTGYTDRLVHSDFVENFNLHWEMSFGDEKVFIEPLFVGYELISGGNYVLNITKFEQNQQEPLLFDERVISDIYMKGVVVFRSKPSNIFMIFYVLKYMRYCNITGIDDISYYKARVGDKEIKYAYIAVNSEFS